jgi:hypothetical protein
MSASQTAIELGKQMRPLKFLLVTCGLTLAMTPVYAHGPTQHASTTASAPAKTTTSVAAPKLQAAMRDLWHAHVVNTREYAFAVKAGDSKRTARAEDAVVANAKQLANAVGGFYGKAAGDQMLTLIGGHWGAIKAMTDASHARDKAASAKSMSALMSNANDIAVFLSGANPNLPVDAVRGLLVAHGAHHAAQINQVMNGDLKGEQATWTAMQAHMDVIADALAAAIAKQFPDKAG